MARQAASAGGISTSVARATRLLGVCITVAGFLNSMWALLGLLSGSPVPHLAALCWGVALSVNYVHCSWCGNTTQQELRGVLLLMRGFVVLYPILCSVAGDVTVVLCIWPMCVPFIIVLVGALRSMGSLSDMLSGHWSASGTCDAVAACVGLTICSIQAVRGRDPCWGVDKAVPMLIAFCSVVAGNLALTHGLFRARIQLLRELDKSNQLRSQLEIELDRSNQLGHELEQELERGNELRGQLRASLQEVSGKLARTRLAVSRIVAGVCDSIFRLDNDLCVSDVSPTLVYLVSGGSSAGELDMLGRSIDSFMSQEDAQRARKAFAISDDGADQRVAAVLPLELVDAGGRPIPVEMYHTRVDETEHIVVLRLRSDDVSTSMGQRGASCRVPTSSMGHTSMPSESSEAVDEAGGEAELGGSGIGSGGRAAANLPAGGDSHHIVFDAGKPDLDVVSASRLFRCAGLGHDESRLLDLVPPRIGRQFDNWIYDEVQRSSSSRAPRSRRQIQSLTLDLPPSPGVHLTAQRAWLEFAGLDRFDAEIPVALRLSGVRVFFAGRTPARAMSTIQEDPYRNQDDPSRNQAASDDEDEEDEQAEITSTGSSAFILPDDSMSQAGASFRME